MLKHSNYFDVKFYTWLEGVRDTLVLCHVNRKKMKVGGTTFPCGLTRRMSKKLGAHLGGLSLQEVQVRLGGLMDPYLWALARSLEALAKTGHSEWSQVLTRQEAMTCAWQLLRELSKEWATLGISSKIDNGRRRHQAARKDFFNRLMSLRPLYPKLMVVRIDVAYGDVYGRDMDPQERLLADWEALKAYLNTAFASSFRGYAAKMEYRAKKGVHMHLLLVFDGSVVRQDVTIARLVGEHWTDVITQGAGAYWNCNTPKYKKRFAHCGVGVFSRSDKSCEPGLHSIADYMTKEDAMVRMVMPDRGKFFSCFFRDVTLKDVTLKPLE